MDFSLSMSAKMIVDAIEKGSNIVLSPMCIALLLNMAASASNGETQAQFLRFLGAKGTAELTSISQAVISLLTDADGDGAAAHALVKFRRSPRYLTVSNPPRGYCYCVPKRPLSDFSVEALIKRRKPITPPMVSMANALWVDHGSPIKPSFAGIADTVYKAFVKNVDLVSNEAKELKEEANLWAEKETKGLIKTILSPTDQLSPPLCLANALYFKGAWIEPFKHSNAIYDQFRLLNGETTIVRFMTTRFEHHRSGYFNDFQLLQLPYYLHEPPYAKDFKMYIFLPYRPDGLKDLVNKFNTDPAMLHPANFQLENDVHERVYIPMMKFSHSFDVKEAVKAKGLTLPFEPRSADFSNMVEGSEMAIGSIIHRTFLEVGMDQRVHTAANLSCTRTKCAFPSHYEGKARFVADHPFLFMVMQGTNPIVFVGAVLDPRLD